MYSSNRRLFSELQLFLKPMVLFLPTARFTEVNSDQSITAGASGIISCSAEGTPTPQMFWKKQGAGLLPKGRFTQLSNGSLYVNPVLSQDNGTYTCTFKQSKGSERVTTKEQAINVVVLSE